NGVKKHQGQMYIADEMSRVLRSSKLIARREEHFYNGNGHQQEKEFDRKVQEYYSLRCVTQILGPVYEAIENAIRIVENEVNSVSDNPVIDYKNRNVFHGGNFHGDYISLEMDKLKLAVTRMSIDRKSTRLNSSHVKISYAVFCLK